MRTMRLGPSDLAIAARILKRGGLVAFPTETVYGLGANALDDRAVRKIFRAKGRPAKNPLIVHVSTRAQADQVAVRIPAEARRLMRRFWPGPLTLVLPKSPLLPYSVTAGLDTVAVRMPAHPIAQELIRLAGVPVAAPSANASGRPSPTSSAHVLDDLDGRIHAVVVGGPSKHGVESTVLDVTRRPFTVLRPGVITPSQISRALGGAPVRLAGRLRLARSPGTKFRHYAPKTPVRLASRAELARRVRMAERQGKTVGLLLAGASPPRSAAVRRVEQLGPSISRVARGLYAALRRLDAKALDLIIAETLPARGLGLAVMNRLRRAAASKPTAPPARHAIIGTP